MGPKELIFATGLGLATLTGCEKTNIDPECKILFIEEKCGTKDAIEKCLERCRENKDSKSCYCGDNSFLTNFGYN